VIAIGIDLCRALAAVHTAGIVHRDVKTTNVLVAESGRIVLADFGLGVHLERGQAGEHSAAGTPVFMAPEVLRGEPADARSDIYALGVVLYRLAAGRLPFEEGRIEELKARIARGEPAPLPAPRSTAEAGLRRVIERALSVDPGARFATAQEMEAALVAISPPFAAGAPPRSRLPALAAAAGIAVLVAWMIWQAWPGSAAKGEFRAGARPGPGAEIEVRADAEVHVYLLREDRRGRRYLLFPRDAEEAAAKLSAGRRLALGHSDPEALRNGARGSLVVLAARDPVLALVDSIPPKGTSAGTGKDGSPRLKPIAVRGLLRTLAQAGWIAEADQASGETEPVLRERLPLVPHSAPSRGGVWAARRALPEGTPEAGAGDDEDDEDDGRGR
jgi:hypothetical protein